MNAAGATRWFIPDAYYPEISSGKHYVSHEAVCVLNTGDTDARIRLTLYFEDRDPLAGFEAECKAGRTHHIRLDKLKDRDGNGVPMGVPYAILAESTVPVIVQYSRLDSTQAEMSLMTTMAFRAD